MRLKENADLIRFLEKVKECEHDVYFYTGEGDKLNLKSTLSQFLFSAVAAEDEMLKSGKCSVMIRRSIQSWQNFWKDDVSERDKCGALPAGSALRDRPRSMRDGFLVLRARKEAVYVHFSA